MKMCEDEIQGKNNFVKVCANHNESEGFPVKSVVLNLSKSIWEVRQLHRKTYTNTLVNTFIYRNEYLHIYTQIHMKV